MISAFANLSKFPDHALLIAEIIGDWNLLEDKCVGLLSVFAGVDSYQADLLLSQLSSPKAKLDAVLAAGQFTFRAYPKELGQLEKVFRSAFRRLAHRHKYAHGVYVVDLKDRLCLEKNMQVLPLAELQTEAAEYVRLLPDLEDIEKSAWDMLPQETVRALTQIWITRRSLRPTNQE